MKCGKRHSTSVKAHLLSHGLQAHSLVLPALPFYSYIFISKSNTTDVQPCIHTLFTNPLSAATSHVQPCQHF